MAKTETFQLRLEPELKADVENVLNQLGMTTTDAVNIFLKQILLKGGLPFEVRLPEPNQTTIQAMKEAEDISNSDTHRFSTADEMFKELGI